MRIVVFSALFLLFCFTMVAQPQELLNEVHAYRTKHIQDMVDYKRPPIQEHQGDEIEYYPINEKWVITADLIKLEKVRKFPMKTSNGQTKYFSSNCKARFSVDENIVELFLFQRTDAVGRVLDRSRYFLPFTDQTTGEETYGGGRYMDISVKAVNGEKVRLNFNVAYNPWCAYGGLYSCPIPPIENNLAIKITAGEKVFHAP